VFEETRVLSINFSNNELNGRPVAAKWQNELDKSVSDTISFEYLIDATGREGIMARKYLKNRKANASLRNVACWGYWKGAGVYGAGTSRENAPWFEALTDQSGWNWFIPLHNGTTSIGVVMYEVTANQRKAAAKRKNDGVTSTLKQHYLDCLHLSPGLIDLLGDAKLVEDGPCPVIQSASDFSYNAPSYSGDHYRLIGDAAAFIDPFFSSGVHLALTGGLAAAVTIASSIRDEYSEIEVCKYHDAKIGVAYTRFLIVVMSAYKQMRAQDHPVLANFEEETFDRAFDVFKPVIHGDADVGNGVSEDELQKVLALCGSKFLPVEQDLQAYTEPQLDNKSSDLSGPPEDIELMVSVESFSNEITAGFTARVNKGSIGLISHA